MGKKLEPACCPPKPELKSRPLLSGYQAAGLEETFKVLGNGTRLRLLHALIRADELCVSEIAAELKMKPQTVSNQLQRLSDLGIVESRRNGLQIHYRIVDPCVVSLLDFGWCLTEDAKSRMSERPEAERSAS